MSRSQLSLTALVQACVGILGLSYTDVMQCADALDELSAACPVEPAHVKHLGSLTSAPSEHAATGSISRNCYLDAVRIDDELLLLVGNHPIRCDGLGATVWLADELVRIAVDQLCEHRVVRRN